jgi:RNA polymerase sigma factor (sigma-70 family)
MIDIEPGLVSVAREGGAPLNQLIEAVWPDVYRIALGVLRNRSLAEECAQETCIGIVGALATLSDVSAFRAWVHRSTMNRAISLGRREQRRTGAIIEEGSITEDRSISIDLQRAIASLPLEQRGLVILHYYAELTSDEIAGTRGIAASTVRFRLMQARRALRKALGDHHPSTQLPNQGVING